MRTLVCGLLCLSLAAVVFAEKPKRIKGKSEGDQATVTVVGSLVCAHCDLSIGTSCATGLQLTSQTGLVIDGKAGKELFNERKGSSVKSITGAVAIKDGNLYLTGQSAADPTEKNAKGTATVVGTLVKAGDKFAIKNGSSDIAVTGKVGDKLPGLVGKKVKVVGALSVDDNHIVVAANSVEAAAGGSGKKIKGKRSDD